MADAGISQNVDYVAQKKDPFKRERYRWAGNWGNVTLIKVTEAAGLLADTFGHTCHLGNPRVIADIQRVLAHEPSDRFPSRRYVASQNRYVIEAL